MEASGNNVSGDNKNSNKENAYDDIDSPYKYVK